MNRRSFIKLVAVAAMAPYLPVAVPAKVIENTGLCTPLWAKALFDYALQNMVFTDFIGKGNESLIQIA